MTSAGVAAAATLSTAVAAAAVPSARVAAAAASSAAVASDAAPSAADAIAKEDMEQRLEKAVNKKENRRPQVGAAKEDEAWLAVDGGLGQGHHVAARGWRGHGRQDAAAGCGRSAEAGVQAGGVCGREDVEQRLELSLRSPPPHALCPRRVHARPGAAIEQAGDKIDYE